MRRCVVPEQPLRRRARPPRAHPRRVRPVVVGGRPIRCGKSRPGWEAAAHVCGRVRWAELGGFSYKTTALGSLKNAAVPQSSRLPDAFRASSLGCGPAGSGSSFRQSIARPFASCPSLGSQTASDAEQGTAPSTSGHGVTRRQASLPYVQSCRRRPRRPAAPRASSCRWGWLPGRPRRPERAAMRTKVTPSPDATRRSLDFGDRRAASARATGPTRGVRPGDAAAPERCKEPRIALAALGPLP